MVSSQSPRQSEMVSKIGTLLMNMFERMKNRLYRHKVQIHQSLETLLEMFQWGIIWQTPLGMIHRVSRHLGKLHPTLSTLSMILQGTTIWVTLHLGQVQQISETLSHISKAPVLGWASVSYTHLTLPPNR